MSIARRWGRLPVAALITMLLLGSIAFASPASAASYYTVQPGDTLGGIAYSYGVPVADLIEANGIDNPNLIWAGQELMIPDGSSGAGGSWSADMIYVVVSGDSIPTIAESFGVPIDEVIAANGLEYPWLIYPGDELVIPGAGVPADYPQGGGTVPGTPAASELPWNDYSSVRSMLTEAALMYDWDPYLIMSLAWWESGWNQQSISWADAIGVMQLLPETAAWAGPDLVGRQVDPYYSTWDNIETGVAFLTHLRWQAGSDYIALAGYYQGLYSVEQDGIFPETREYALGIIELRDSFANGSLP